MEKRGFADNAALGSVSKSSYLPVLFHKDEVGAGASNLSDSVRKEIRNDDRRIVGVVLNVVRTIRSAAQSSECSVGARSDSGASNMYTQRQRPPDVW